jgi:hypothetical protein
MEVVFDRDDGVPFEFRLLANGAKLRGEEFGKKISATVCQKTPWKFLELETPATTITATPTAVDFHIEGTSGNTSA